MNVISICPLCGGGEQKEVFRSEQLLYVACGRCGLVFLRSRPTEQEFSRFYESEFQDKRRNLTTVEASVERLQRMGSYEKKKDFVPYLAPYFKEVKTCLEIGGGWGTLGKVIQDSFGCEVYEVEPSKLAAAVASEFYGLKSFPVDFATFIQRHAQERKYDAAVLVHVFEHVLDPNEFLEKLQTVLSQGAVVFLAMPDVLNLDAPPESFYHIEHCFYYSPKTIEMLLAKHGFRVLELWRTTSDMRIACVADHTVRISSFDNAEYDAIMGAIGRMRKKYAVLRRLKSWVGHVVGPEQLARLTKVAARGLRRVGIIKV